jgi:hypothetical protein
MAEVRSAIFVVVTDPFPGVECPDPEPPDDGPACREGLAVFDFTLGR